MVRPRRSAEIYGQGHRSDRNGEIEAQADKAKAPKRKRGNPSVVDVDPAKVQEVLARIRPQIDAADFGLIKGMAETLTFVMDLLRKQRTTIARLRRVFRFTSEKTATVVGGTDQGSAGASEETSEATTKPAADAADGSDPAAAAPPRPAEEKPKPKPKAKGHGRIATSEYETAQHIPVAHQSLCAGNVCPGCACGTLYDTKAPAQVLRITGQPVLAAVCWDCQRLRCSACGVTYTAPAPKEAQGSKYDESAVSMLALCRYGLGLPHHRLERLQHHLQTPVPASTQWDVLNENAPIFQPILKEMERVAAQGRVIQDDDSYGATRKGWSRRNEDAMTSGNLVSRPAGAKPARPGVSPPRPVASLAPRALVTGRAMRRCAKVRAMSKTASKIIKIPGAQGFIAPEGHGGWTHMGEGQPQPAGSRTMARSKRTTQKPGRPQTLRGESRHWGTGEQPRQTRLSLSRWGLGNKKLRQRGRAACRDDRRADRRSWGVGGPHRSGEVGERGHPDPMEQRRAV